MGTLEKLNANVFWIEFDCKVCDKRVEMILNTTIYTNKDIDCYECKNCWPFRILRKAEEKKAK